MTPLPKKKLSRLRQGRRRANIKISTVTLTKCENCGSPMIPHRACPNCGKYRGRMVAAPDVKTTVKRVTKEQ